MNNIAAVRKQLRHGNKIITTKCTPHVVLMTHRQIDSGQISASFETFVNASLQLPLVWKPISAKKKNELLFLFIIYLILTLHKQALPGTAILYLIRIIKHLWQSLIYLPYKN